MNKHHYLPAYLWVPFLCFMTHSSIVHTCLSLSSIGQQLKLLLVSKQDGVFHLVTNGPL